MSEIKFKPDAIAVGPSMIKIKVGDKVLNASGVKLHIGHDEGTKDTGAWEQPISKSWEISGSAMFGPKDGIKDFIVGVLHDKWDVTIGQEVGKLPRKMKKALHSKRMTKCKYKVASYINRRQIRIHNAEMVVSHDQMETLKATISGGTIEPDPISEMNKRDAADIGKWPSGTYSVNWEDAPEITGMKPDKNIYGVS